MSLNNKNYLKISCALSHDQVHVVRKPKLLNCGHSICTSCFLELGDNEECKICGLKMDFNEKDSKRFVKLNLNKLFQKLKEDTGEEMNKFKSLLENRDEILDNHIKYVEDEVEIRIESLKLELDCLFETFKQELWEIKRNILNFELSDQNKKLEVYDVGKFENNFDELVLNTENEKWKTEDNFFDFQENLLGIRALVKVGEENLVQNSKIYFEISDDKIKREMIGILKLIHNMPYYTSNEKVQEIIGKADYLLLPINVRPQEISVLPNNYIVSANVGSLVIYDEDFKKIKSIQMALPSGIAFNFQNDLFVSERKNSLIFKMDFYLDIKREFGSPGFNNDQLQRPCSLVCKDNFLYVCDYGNDRIQVLSYDFEYINTIKLSIRPFSMQIIDNTIGIHGSDGLYFYDLETQSEINSYKKLLGRMSKIGSHFYVFTYSPSKLFFSFDSKGTKISEIQIKRYNGFISDWCDCSLLAYKDDLLMSSHIASEILRIRN